MNELLGELEEKVTTKLKINIRNHKVLPTQAKILSRRPKYIKSNLRDLGIIIRPSDDHNTKIKTIIVENTKFQQNVGNISIPPIHRYLTESRVQITSDISIGNGDSIDTCKY